MRSKNDAQYMVGLPRNSELQHFYLEEAQAHGVKLPTWIRQLLKDRYEALQGNRGQGVWFPRWYQLPAAPISPSVEEEDPLDARVATRPHVAIAVFGGEDED